MELFSEINVSIYTYILNILKMVELNKSRRIKITKTINLDTAIPI